MQKPLLCETVYGYPICVYMTTLDDGINVLLVGGAKTHVGAISHALPGRNVFTIQIPPHREAAVSEKWARALADTAQSPACVECGIHYDNATKEEIEGILAVCDRLLTQLKNLLV